MLARRRRKAYRSRQVLPQQKLSTASCAKVTALIPLSSHHSTSREVWNAIRKKVSRPWGLVPDDCLGSGAGLEQRRPHDGSLFGLPATDACGAGQSDGSAETQSLLRQMAQVHSCGNIGCRSRYGCVHATPEERL